MESPEINPCTHGQLTCNKGGKNYNGEKTISLISFDGKTWQLHVKKKKNEIRAFSNIHKKINSKCIKDLNIRLDNIKLKEDNIGRTLYNKLQPYLLGSVT